MLAIPPDFGVSGPSCACSDLTSFHHSIHEVELGLSDMAFLFSDPPIPTTFPPPGSGRVQFSTAAGGGGNEFSGESAYEVLGVSETSSAAEIKASFRRLAKETHPDTAASPAASHRFLQILAAYEILSDSEKRAYYDSFLFSQRSDIQRRPGFGSVMYTCNSSTMIKKQSEVVEWIQRYRLIIDDIISNKKVVDGSGYFDNLESELYSAIRAAYFGPLIESMDLLPDCFEAEERSTFETSEVLHLVSGRDLFGIVCLVDNVCALPDSHCEKLTSSSVASGICQYAGQSVDTHEMQARQQSNFVSDVYKDLELHIFGRVVATASRSPPRCKVNGVRSVYSEDRIHVFISPNEEENSTNSVFQDSVAPNSVGSQNLLGTITGLGTEGEEGICSVFDRSGTKTHVVMKHRTLMVKHMHWHQVVDKVSTCECRCSRARLPPSRFWLFEPRCGMHDIGGWYIETFGRDKKGRTMPSQREWDSMNRYHDKRLHPAMYLLALAYRTLDLEDANRRKQTIRKFVEPKLHTVFRWCKRRF